MKIEELLKEKGQEHLLRFFGELSERERRELLAEISRVDWDTLALLESPEDLSGKGKISPIPVLSLSEIEKDRARYAEIGKKMIAEGKLAAVLLAGGQGTRLGSDAPKGTFDIGITAPLYIFQQLIENLLCVVHECGAYVPLFIMTSEKNDAVTRAFFEEHGYFGYEKAFVRFFLQEMAPSVDFSGKLFLEEKGRLALSPNGNGGWFSSLMRTDIMDGFPAVEWFNVFAVDNVLQRIADPVFLGATVSGGFDSGAKGVRKVNPEEKVGVLCLQDGLPGVIEYYEMTSENKNLRDSDGNLVYSFGVILNYLFRFEKLREAAKRRIPVHIVKKKVSYIDERGEHIVPETENGYKFETLILDMVRLMGTCLPFEVVREREFAPIKNRTGVDSVDSARELLKYNGVKL